MWTCTDLEYLHICVIRNTNPKQKEDAASSLALPSGTRALGVNVQKLVVKVFKDELSPVKL